LASELDLLRELFESQYAAFKDQSERAKQLISIGESKPETTDKLEALAATTIVAQTILNLDATIWNR